MRKITMTVLLLISLISVAQYADAGEAMVTQTRKEITEAVPDAHSTGAAVIGRSKAKSEDFLKNTALQPQKVGKNAAGETQEVYTSDQVHQIVNELMQKQTIDSIIDERTASLSHRVSEQSTSLTLIVLVFGLLSMAALYIYSGIKKADIGNNNLKIIGIVFIASAALCLITAGFDNAQITPVIGILGTMAGYLLSSHAPSTGTDTDPAKPEDPATGEQKP